MRFLILIIVMASFISCTNSEGRYQFDSQGVQVIDTKTGNIWIRKMGTNSWTNVGNLSNDAPNKGDKIYFDFK